MLGRISLGSGLCAFSSGIATLLALHGAAALAAPCGGEHPLAIGIFGPLTGASRDFGEMALSSVKLASADFEKAGGCSIEIKPYDSQAAVSGLLSAGLELGVYRPLRRHGGGSLTALIASLGCSL